MKKKIWTSAFLLLLAFSTFACGSEPTEGSPSDESIVETSTDSASSENTSSSDSSDLGGEEGAKYTVTWKNYDGALLETDNDVQAGATPVYDGATPTKEGSGDFTYTFGGWTPLLSEVAQDSVYTATFKHAYNGQSVVGMQPSVAENGNILYGLYPQTYVGEESVVSALNALSPTAANGWYLYEGEYYAKETAKVYNNETYTFDDGTAITNGTEYWFKCEPIEWQVLSEEDGSYYLLSTLLLDAQAYYGSYEDRTLDGQTVFANNYAESDIRAWLNGEFYETAFYFNDVYLQTRRVENGASTTELAHNPYASKTTQDNVLLLSYQEYLKADYGFLKSGEKSSTREAKTTDYARAVGAWCHTRNNKDEESQANGSYWTRSPSGEYGYCATVVNSGGFMSTYAVDEESHAVRPAIYLSVEGLTE